VKIPYLSIIITTRNEELNILRCLESISAADLKCYARSGLFSEIIIVDNFSTDRTISISEKFRSGLGGRDNSLRIIQSGPERSAQRNTGIKNAGAEYILYLDADMTISEDLLIELFQKYIIPQREVAVYIPEHIPGDRFWSRLRHFERSFYNATVIDAVRFFPKKIFMLAGGFPETMTAGEDWFLDRKIRKLTGTSVSTGFICHHEKSGITAWFKKKYYYAEDFRYYLEKSAGEAEIKKQFGFYYRFFGVFTENGKWQQAVQKPHYLLCIFFLKIITGFFFYIKNIKILHKKSDN